MQASQFLIEYKGGMKLWTSQKAPPTPPNKEEEDKAASNYLVCSLHLTQV
jgi:hypothetical protein